MKKQIASLALGTFFGLGILAAAPQAQDQSNTAPNKESHHRRQPDPQREVNALGKKLNLTDDQKNQILPILTDRQQQMQSIHSDSSLSAEDRRTKMRTLWEDSDGKIKAVLNDTQKQKYDQMQQERRDRMQQHRQEQGQSQSNPQ